MADRSERDRDDARSEEDVKDDSRQSEATPGAGRDRDTAYDSATSGGAADDIEDASDTPPPAQRGRDLDH